MKGPSEAEFGAALRGVDLTLFAYKPPDDARNRKPCDFMVWYGAGQLCASAVWFEVKATRAVAVFPTSGLRPAQILGIREAKRVGIPYWLAIYWQRHQDWTISDAIRVQAYTVERGVTSVTRELLMSRFGIQANPSQLGSTLKSVLLGEVD